MIKTVTLSKYVELVGGYTNAAKLLKATSVPCLHLAANRGNVFVDFVEPLQPVQCYVKRKWGGL